MMMMKTKKVKLYGEKLRKLNTAIHERDGNCCIICGRYVDPGEKFHHEPCGALEIAKERGLLEEEEGKCAKQSA